MVATRRTSRQKTPLDTAPAPVLTDAPPSPTASSTSKKHSLPAEDQESAVPAAKRSKSESPPPANGSAEKPRFPSPPNQPVTEYEKEQWQGFCEIASEPEYFSVMMREFGVQDVCARQAFPDVDDLKNLPQPIYGFVFLLRYREFDAENQAESCPEGVWFANQLPAQNSCSTMAIFHILMNTPGLDIGENLKEFASFTKEMAPMNRGESLANFDFVKRIHNSFANKMDMLLCDSITAHKAQKAEETKTKGLKRKQSVTSIESDESIDDDSAHHYLAFLPINGEVWKLDGMNAQPTSLGKYDEENSDEWLNIACTRIQMLMATAGDEDYQLFALCRAPAAQVKEEMCTCIKTVEVVETTLTKRSKEWKSFIITDGDKPIPSGPPSPLLLSSLGIPEEQLDATTVEISLREKIDDEDMSDLLDRRERLLVRISALQDKLMSEMAQEAEEKEKADERRWDFAPAARVWLEMLAENGHLQKTIAAYKDDLL